MMEYRDHEWKDPRVKYWLLFLLFGALSVPATVGLEVLSAPAKTWIIGNWYFLLPLWLLGISLALFWLWSRDTISGLIERDTRSSKRSEILRLRHAKESMNATNR